MLRNIFATACVSSVLASGIMASGIMVSPVLADGPHDFLSGTYLDGVQVRANEPRSDGLADQLLQRELSQSCRRLRTGLQLS